MRALFAWFSAVALLSVAGCGDGVTPELSNLRLVGQAPDSPVVLIFQFDFVDGDGDLGDGVLETFIDGQSTSLGGLELEPLFIRNELPLDANSGTVEFVLELALNDNALPDSGTQFEIGLRAIDAAERASNEVSRRLELTY